MRGGDEQKVSELSGRAGTAAAAAEGVTVEIIAPAVGGVDVSDVIVNGRGTMIYFTAPEGYRIEVSCQRSNFA